MKIQPSGLVNALSGALQGSVARTTKQGTLLCSKAGKPKFASNAWSNVKSRFASVMASWNSLTATKVAGWNSLAAGMKGSNIFGDKFTYSGIAVFQMLNNNLVNVGESIITDAPTLAAVELWTVFSATAVHAGAVTVTFAATPVPAGDSVVLMATKALKPTVKVKDSDFRQITVLAAAETSPFTATTVYNAKFGSPAAAGLVVYFRAYHVNTATGQAGLSLQCQCTTS